MSSLLAIPTHILGQICDGLEQNDLGHLWFTGCKSLLHSLGNRGALTSASFTFLTTPRGLPTMLYSCPRLTWLEIRNSGVCLGHPSSLWYLISSFSLLQHLHLDFVEAEAWLFDYGPSPDLARLFDDEGISGAGLPLNPIAEYLPHLEYLHLEAGKPALEPYHIELLPKSLTHLRILSALKMDLDSLPYYYELPKIRTIFVYHNTSEEVVGVLAPSITSIHFEAGSLLSIPASFWEKSNLIEFSGKCTIETYLQLPSTVEALHFPDVPWQGEWSPDECHELLKELCTYLPNLKELSFPNSFNTVQGEWTPFPSKLEFLSFLGLDTQRFQFENPPPIALPPTLKTLLMEDFREPQAFMQAVPGLSSLTRLEIGMRTQCFLNADFLLNLPATLLHLKVNDSVGRFLSMKAICVDSAIPSLSRQLKSLIMSHQIYFITSSFAKHLPRSLQRLSIGFIFDRPAEPLVDDQAPAEPHQSLADHISDLPRSITNLLLAHEALNFHDEPNTVGHPENTTWTLDMFKNLPFKCLASLDIMEARDTSWTPEMMALLPPDLTHLRFFRCGDFGNEAAAALPRKLRSFQCVADAQTLNLTSKCFSSLPRTLTLLELKHTCKVDEEGLTQLPPYLHILLLKPQLPHLSESSAKFLPASIGVAPHPLDQGLRPLLSSARANMTRRNQCLVGFARVDDFESATLGN